MDSLGARTWALHDALGSVRQTLDDAGAPLSPTGYAYTPFGAVQSGAEPAPFGFTGELHADDLVYLRARWYDPASGTFLGRDPFEGFARVPYSLHPYQYAYAAPTMWTDPSGLLAIFVHGGFGSHESGTDAAAEDDTYRLGNMVEGLPGLGNIQRQGPGDITHLRPADEIYNITRQVRQAYDDSCGKEPIVLVGYSRGGAAVYRATEWLATFRPDIRVDLVVTIAPVFWGHGLRRYPSVDIVERHLNFLSWQGTAASLPDEDNLTAWPDTLVIPEAHISSATNITIPGTSHHSIIEHPMMRVWKKAQFAPEDPHENADYIPGERHVYVGKRINLMPILILHGIVETVHSK